MRFSSDTCASINLSSVFAFNYLPAITNRPNVSPASVHEIKQVEKDLTINVTSPTGCRGFRCRIRSKRNLHPSHTKTADT